MKLRKKLALSLTLGLGFVVSMGSVALTLTSCSNPTNQSIDTPIESPNNTTPPNNIENPQGNLPSIPSTPTQPPQPLPPTVEEVTPAPSPSIPPAQPLPPEEIVPTPSPSVPQVPTEPAQMMTFTVDVRRTSGFKFNTIIPVNIVDVATNQNMFNGPRDDYDDSEVDGIITFELPDNKTYKVTLTNFKSQTYHYNNEIILDKEHPHGSFDFNPVIETSTKEGSYAKDDVSHELPFPTDVLNHPISLQKNRENGKMSIIMYMKTSCPKSIRTLNSIYSAVKYADDNTPTPENTQKIELYCFSDDDTQQELKDFVTRKGFNESWIHFVADPTNKIRNAYFPYLTGYPKLAFVDYQGVLVNKIEGELTNQNTIRRFMNNYSKQGGNY